MIVVPVRFTSVSLTKFDELIILLVIVLVSLLTIVSNNSESLDIETSVVEFTRSIFLQFKHGSIIKLVILINVDEDNSTGLIEEEI